MRVLNRLMIAGALVGMGLVVGCDSAPGPEELDQRAPVLSDFSFSPSGVVLEQLPPDQIDGETVRVPLALSVTARDPDGRIEEVRYVVQSPFSSAQPLAEGVLTAGANNRYTASGTLTLQRAEVGAYTVIVYAVDNDRKLSGEVRGALNFVATGRPPVIEDIEVPASVTRPAPGEPDVVFQFIATVSDPDGLRNIDRVEVDLEGLGTLRLCDDGGEGVCNTGFPDSGDETAGDGRFTLTLQIDSNNAAATLMLRFRAIDRTGLASDVVEQAFSIL